MSEAPHLGGDEGYEARDDDATPPRWPSSSWCNYKAVSIPAQMGRDFLLRRYSDHEEINSQCGKKDFF